ncbi:hypothetical protein H8B13_14565 [Hymenobacter sp. BT188]|uniref:hypothetical protein n=1 Tax=Hymenobacter sp. BT188 TaxID=2763504 RepID=UPI001651835A|nr:hypothetical protein [Hymenobacter sp. BT188]MBC6608047.1 hypothetical protein [Hymenobacter sp. BT188]
MTTFSALSKQLHCELQPLMHAAEISPQIQQQLLARLTLFLLFTSRQPPATLSVRVPQPLEGAELTLYYSNGQQITLLTRHTRSLAPATEKLYDTMVTLQQRGRQLIQKACYSWEMGKVFDTYCNRSA